MFINIEMILNHSSDFKPFEMRKKLNSVLCAVSCAYTHKAHRELHLRQRTITKLSSLLRLIALIRRNTNLIMTECLQIHAFGFKVTVA